MKTWKEYESNIFNYFKYFNDELDRNSNDVLPDMSVISLNASGISGKEDRLRFITLCSNEIHSLFSVNNMLEEYKFYLLVNKMIEDVNSKVENYKKIWRGMNKDWSLVGFIKGPELKLEIGQNFYFSSIAQFNIENFSNALEIATSNSRLNSIIISKQNDILTEDYIKKISHILFNCKSQHLREIDYYSLCIHCCSEGDIAIRWGTSFEEVEVALIYNPQMINFKI